MENQAKQPWWEPAIRLFLQLSGYILAPLILAFFVGRYLDERFGTSPWIFLTILGIAFVISNILIVRKSATAIDEIELSNTNNHDHTEYNQGSTK